MLKLKVNMGTRNGWIILCSGKRGTDNYVETDVADFQAWNATKHYLYDVYDWIESHTCRVLATLTSTGKTKVILVEDNFLDLLRDFDSSKEVSVVWWK